MNYYVSRMKDISITTINEFETEDANGTKKYSRMIIEEGYRANIWYPFAKFGFIIERADSFYEACTNTMSEFKKRYAYNSTIIDMYNKYKETKEYVEVFLPEKDVIYIRAQTISDTWRTNYDGSHCSQYYKLIGFRIAPRNEI